MRLFRKKPSSSERAQSLAERLHIAHSLLIRREDISLGPELGKGGFGTVFKAKLTGNDSFTDCVAKQINVARVSTKDLPLLRTELQVWSEVDHPNCLKFIGVSLEPKEYLLMCELMEGGSLQEFNERAFVARRAPLEATKVITRLQMISSAMDHLHDRAIIHRDLKSANILLTEDTERLVVADFGLARYCQQDVEQFTAETGSYRWMAPEVMRHEPYDRACDVYSFAILAWEILTYDIPFNTVSPVEAAFAVALRAERPQLPRHCPAPLENLLTSCWHQDATRRPTFKQVKQMLGEISLLDCAASGSAVAAPVPASALSRVQGPAFPRVPSKRKLGGDGNEAGGAGGGDALPRVSSKRKISGEPEIESTELPMKRPESISSGLHLVHLRESSAHGKGDPRSPSQSPSPAIRPCA